MELSEVFPKMVTICREVASALGTGWYFRQPEQGPNNWLDIVGPEGRAFMLYYWQAKGKLVMRGVLLSFPGDPSRHLPSNAEAPSAACSCKRDTQAIVRDFLKRLRDPYEELFTKGQQQFAVIRGKLEAWQECANCLAVVMRIQPPKALPTGRRSHFSLSATARASGTVEPNFDGTGVDLHLRDIPLEMVLPFLAALCQPEQEAQPAAPSSMGPLRVFGT